MPRRHITVRLMGCRCQELSWCLQRMLMKYGSQQQALVPKLEFSSFACQLNHFLEERDELLFNLLCFFVRDFAIKQRIGNEFLDVGDWSGNVCTFRYHLALLTAIYRSLDLLGRHLRQRLRLRHKCLHQTLYDSVYHFFTSFIARIIWFDEMSAAWRQKMLGHKA